MDTDFHFLIYNWKHLKNISYLAHMSLEILLSNEFFLLQIFVKK